jgi:hypothetical protein
VSSNSQEINAKGPEAAVNDILPIDVKPLELMPRFVTIEGWIVLSSMSRPTAYDHVAKGHLVAHKVGGTTLIDVAASIDWIKSQPAPKLKLRPVARSDGRSNWLEDEVARLLISR